MSKLRSNTLFILVVLAALLGSGYASASPAVTPSTVQPMIAVQSFMVPMISVSSFSDTYKKIGTLATFNVLSSNSMVELVFNGRIYVQSFSGDATGANFELRVDGMATEYGVARAYVRDLEAGERIPVSITGLFHNLAVGPHTASMYVNVAWLGSGTNAQVNPGGWETDHLVVKEYTPIGFVYLPLTQK